MKNWYDQDNPFYLENISKNQQGAFNKTNKLAWFSFTIWNVTSHIK